MVSIDAISTGFLGQLTASDRDRFASEMNIVRYSDGREIIACGHDNDDVYFVLSGRAIAVQFSQDGKRVAYREIQPGDIFGELAALTGRPRIASVEAQGAVVAGVLSAAQFIEIVRKHSEIALVLSRHLARMVSAMSERVFEHSALLVRQRLCRELLRRAATTEPVSDRVRLAKVPTHAELAAYLGTHREGVTKELSALERAGLIVRARSTLEIRSISALEAYVWGEV